jgi:hypothetical protein
MAMKKIIYILPFLLLMACGPSDGEGYSVSEADELEVRIRQLHDVETMPKMSRVNQLFEKAEGTDTPEAQVLAKKLLAADDAMMLWMQEFKWNKELPSEERAAYYKEEVAKLEQLKIQIDAAIAQGEALLGTE